MGQWPFVGRETEFEAIRSAFADFGVGGVVVIGDAGVGKTRLTREALDAFASDGCEISWVAATSAAKSIPFGAVAHLMPDDWGPDGDRLSVLSVIAARVRGWSKRTRVVIGVDDAHLLDDGSAAVLAHLVVQRLAFLLVTVRGGVIAPDAITALWKDDLARHLELKPLSAGSVDQLIDHVLAGDVEGYSRQLCHRTAAGNPLALHELLHGAISSGGLRLRYGVWRFEGRYSPTVCIHELVNERLGTAPGEARLVLELLACGEPLPVAMLEQLAGYPAVEAAEACGMATAERDGARVSLRLAHPLYGEVLRHTMSASRARQLRRRLAAAALAGPMRRRQDVLRASLWQVEGGEVVRPDIVRIGARDAMGRADLELAERLARAARDAEPGEDTDQLLAAILALRGRGAEARAVMPGGPSASGHGLVRWAVTRANAVYGEHGDSEEAARVLELAAAEPGGEMAGVAYAWFMLIDGRCAVALSVARQVLESGSERAAVMVIGVGIAAAGFLGRAEEADELSERAVALVAAFPREKSWLCLIGYGRCLAYLALGEPDKAWDVADRGYRAAVQVPLVAAGWAGLRGQAEIAQGRPASAGRSLREAVAVLEDNDTFWWAWFYDGALAAAAALRGDVGEARTWTERADRLPGPRHRLLAPWFRLWGAWTMAAEGNTTAAIKECQAAAELARDLDIPTVEAAALYDVVRLGGPRHDRLTELAAALRTPAAAAQANAGKGIASADGGALTEAGTAFAALGSHLLAAEAFSAAAHAYRQAGIHTRAALAAEQAAEMRSKCEGAMTPLLAQTPAIAQLTHREREVALLAAKHSSKQIAELLGLSTATVNNHLARAYMKLGISRRAQLATLLYSAYTDIPNGRSHGHAILERPAD